MAPATGSAGAGRLRASDTRGHGHQGDDRQSRERQPSVRHDVARHRVEGSPYIIDMSTEPESVRAERSTLSALAVFVDRRTLVMLALGFSAGLPFLLVFDTLSAWLRASGLSLEVIGFFSLVTMIYSFKFLWAPLVDRTAVPVLTAWLGHRRSWMLVCQGLIMLGLWLVAGTDPASGLVTLAVFAVFVGFSSATQDIAIDAWRIEAADVSRQGAMAAAYQWGYRVATLVAGAAPLLLADAYGWNFSYAVMAALMTVGVIGVMAAPPEEQHAIRSIHCRRHSSRSAHRRSGMGGPPGDPWRWVRC